MNHHIFLVKQHMPEVEGFVYLPKYGAYTSNEVEMLLRAEALSSGYNTAEELLKARNQEIVKCQINECAQVDGAIAISTP